MESEVESSEQYWIKPGQVQEMRLATHKATPDYLQTRDKLLLRAMYQWGFRAMETAGLDVEMFGLEDSALRIPSRIQKDYPTGNSPPPATIDLTGEDVGAVNDYLNFRWKDTEALFPTRSSDRITTRSIENVVEKLAKEAEIHRIPQTVSENQWT